MKKKNYITPEINEVVVKIESYILAGSGESYDDPTTTPREDEEIDL